MTFQEVVLKLQDFWAKKGCAIVQPYDTEKGAATFHPATFLRCLGSKPWKAAYVEPCRRPTDGRYGENPFRLQHYYQFQVVLKPSPLEVQDIYLESLVSLGIEPLQHDIRFVEDNWESPTLGASGVGWEVWVDGMEITQFTYFQQLGGFELNPITVELTYGLERVTMYLANTDNVFDLKWNEWLRYGDMHLQDEVEFSKYNFEEAPVDLLFESFERHEAECKRLLEKGLLMPAYEQCMKCSHEFNLLDARGAISVTSRQDYILRVRSLAKACAKAYLEREG